jgi:hypothetical protein
MINPNQLGRRPFPAGASQWMLVGLRGGAPPPVGLNDGDPVTTWTDSSGNGHAAANTGSARPTFKTAIVNGKPVVRFASSSSQLLNLASAVSSALPLTIFAVMKPASTSTGVICSISGATGFNPIGPLGNSTDGAMFVGNRAFYWNTTLANVGEWRTAFNVYTFQPSLASFLRNGSAIGLTGNANANVIDFSVIGADPGSSFWSDGDLAEIIFYNTEASATDRANVEKYLGTKYAITVAGGSAVQPDTVTGLAAWWKADSLGT